MAFLIAAPGAVMSAAAEVATIGSTLNAANAAAAARTTNLLAAAEDDVSMAIAALFDSHAQAYQALSAQASAFHAQFLQALTAGASSYAAPRPPTPRPWSSSSTSSTHPAWR